LARQDSGERARTRSRKGGIEPDRLTDLVAKIKAGKTTYALGEFARKALAKGAVVYLTEQPSASFRVSLNRAGLLEGVNLFILPFNAVAGMQWPTIARMATEKCKEVGALLLVVDKNSRLESQLSACVAALLREGRASVISAKLEERRKIEETTREREREELARRIAEEEKRVKDLDIWVMNWTRAKQTREFVAALEKVWTQEGHDLSPEAPKGQRIIWMKQQADRLDPMLPSPPSILDRKGELVPRWQYS
jgi:hypothetical protein